jgi:hypothetical protein
LPIQSPHPLYQANIDQWQRCRDAYTGEDAVKAGGTKYLPMIDPSQSQRQYSAYKTRAMYYEAPGRTVDGFVGAVSRKPHIIELPPALADFETDATTDGTSLDEFIKKLCFETLLLARCGVLVDFDDDAQRSYLAIYQAESILNWTSTGVVLQEVVYEPDSEDIYALKSIEQIRQLELVGGVYTVTLWRKSASALGSEEWSIFDVATPTKRGSRITELPWFWLSSMGRSSRIEKPPLLGLVNVSLSHYRSSADLEHGRHFTAIPTLYITGKMDDEPVSVGGGSVITLSEPSSKVGYAEFSGQGLSSLENALESKQLQMATLGAAIWGTKKGIESAETARIRTAGENSLLMGVVSAVEDTLVEAVQFAADWMGISGKITIQINRDFIDQGLDGPTLLAMVQAFQAGAMSIETFLYNLQQAELLPPDTEIQEEVAALNAAAAKKSADALKLAQATKPTVAAPAAQKSPAGAS